MSALVTTLEASASAECVLLDFLPEQLTTGTVNPDFPVHPLVTIIIACYNGATYLEEALLSALAQSHPAVEIVVVDDGSTDDSPKIAQRFPVRYIRQRNRGKSAARNRGIQESKGAYVVFLDADDRLKPEAIESGLRAIARHPDCVFAVGDHVFISADGGYLSRSKKVAKLRFHYEALLKSNFIEMISTVLFRRSVFDEVGGFDASLTVAEDYDLYLRIARMWPVCCHAAVVAEYRKHDANISRNSELMLTTTLRVLEGQAKYVAHNSGQRRVFLAGLRSWRRQYGRQLASELATDFFAMTGDQRRRKLMLLANHYPPGLAILLLLRIAPGLRRRHAVPYGPQEFAPGANLLGAARRQQLISNPIVASRRGPGE